MLTSDLKAKEAIYEVVEPRYFEKSVSLSEERARFYIRFLERNRHRRIH